VLKKMSSKGSKSFFDHAPPRYAARSTTRASHSNICPGGRSAAMGMVPEKILHSPFMKPIFKSNNLRKQEKAD
jgi:hypothetical protein